MILRIVVLFLVAPLGGCLFISDWREARRLDPDGDGVLWPLDCDDYDSGVGRGVDALDSGLGDCDHANAVPVSDAADSVIYGEEFEAYLGLGLAFTDLDGDGMDELLLSTPYASEGGSHAGALYFLRVPDDGSHTTVAAATWGRIDGEYAGDGLGRAIAAGDLDGTGVDDDLVLASNTDVWVAYGPQLGTTRHVNDLASTAHYRPDEPMDTCGGEVVVAETDGSAPDELFVGCPNSPGGAVFVVPGGPTGAYSLQDVGFTLQGRAGGFGTALAAAGDVDGDGLGDVVVGAPGDGTAFVAVGPIDSDRQVWYEDRIIEAPCGAVSAFGQAVAGAGDVDGDGLSDIAIGSPSTGCGGVDGAVYVYTGEAGGSVVAYSAALTGDSPSDLAGFSLDGAGDLDTDGYADLLIGAPAWGGGRGGAYLVHGPILGSMSLVDAELVYGSSFDDYLGVRVVGGGRGDSGSTGEIAITADLDYGALNTGAVYLFSGGF